MPELRLRDRILHATAGWHATTDPACREYKPTREGSAFDARSRGVECKPCADGRSITQPAHAVICPECDERIPIPITVEIHEGGEGPSLAATPDLADLWAHVWTHNEGGDDE